MTSRSNRELRVYGAPMGSTPVNTSTAGRPQVGQADAAKRRSALDAQLNQSTRATGVAPRKKPQPLPGGPVRSTYDQLRLRGSDTNAEINKRSK